ncbi:MAG: hypothetical protein ABIY62_03470 [Ginsengibacter sp.]
MEHEEVIDSPDNSDKDIAHNWVSSSRFLFYCQLIIIAAIILGGCYTMYTHRYKGKPDVEVPGNTLYNPQYK